MTLLEITVSDNGGWIVSAILGALGIGKGVWDYFKRLSDNNTKVKLHDNDQYALSKEELSKQHKELIAKFDELENNFIETDKKLQRALDAFEIIFPLIKKMVENNPEYKEVFDHALKHFQSHKKD